MEAIEQGSMLLGEEKERVISIGLEEARFPGFLVFSGRERRAEVLAKLALSSAKVVIA